MAERSPGIYTAIVVWLPSLSCGHGYFVNQLDGDGLVDGHVLNHDKWILDGQILEEPR